MWKRNFFLDAKELSYVAVESFLLERERLSLDRAAKEKKYIAAYEVWLRDRGGLAKGHALRKLEWTFDGEYWK